MAHATMNIRQTISLQLIVALFCICIATGAAVPPTDLPFAYAVNDGTVCITEYLGNETGVLTVPEEIDGRPVTAIGTKAFYAGRMQTIALLSTLQTIGEEAFARCIRLTGVSIPEGVQILPEKTFSHCIALADVQLPDTLLEIGPRAFDDCRSLTGIVLPASLETIGNWSFSDCRALQTVSLPASLVHLGQCAFLDCSSLRTVHAASAVRIPEAAFSNCSELSDVTLLKAAEIGIHAFGNCRNLTKIWLPASLRQVKRNAFQDTPLQQVYFEGARQEWNDIRVAPIGNETLQTAAVYAGAGTPADSDAFLEPSSPLLLCEELGDRVLIGLTAGSERTACTVGDVLDQIVVPEGGAARITRNGADLPASDFVATGDIVAFDPSAAQAWTIIVRGDVLGTGILDLPQIIRMAQAINGIDPLTGYFAAAADFNGDGSCDLTDLVQESRLYTQSSAA